MNLYSEYILKFDNGWNTKQTVSILDIISLFDKVSAGILFIAS